MSAKSQALLEQRAAAITRRVAAQVRRRPSARALILANNVWTGKGGGAEGWARREAGRQVDRDAGRKLSEPLSEQDYADRRFEDRLQTLHDRGVEIRLDSSGRWLRREEGGGNRLVPVETPHELLQGRVVRAEAVARAAAIAEAQRLGVKVPPAGQRFRWSDYDRRLERLWADRLAMETSRIAHDALVDAWRDSAWDRMEDAQDLWVRRCQINACGACLALADGVPRPATDRTFYRHTRCRCVPEVWIQGSDTNPPTGYDIFWSLTEAQQDALFAHRGGAVKAQALRDGVITLDDLVQVAQERVGRTQYVLGETPTKDLPLVGA